MKRKKILIIPIFFCYIIASFFNNKTVVNESNTYMSKQDFLDRFLQAAINEMKDTGVFASVTLGQAAQEGGWGKDEIAIIYNNYFGMKNFSPVTVNGQENVKCNEANYKMIGKASNTNTYYDGTSVCLKASEGGYAWFRVYESPENSIGDHSRNLWCHTGNNYINAGVFDAKNASEQVQAIENGGYATDNYYEEVYEGVIKPNNFEQYDVLYELVKPSYAETCDDNVYMGKPLSINDGNYVREYKTAYDGDIKQGYLYTTQAKNAIKNYSDKMKVEEIDDRVNNVVNDIFGKAGNYEDNKHGSAAYDPNVTYLEGSYKNQVPYYNQGDYPDSPYGSYGTIKSHGCGTTSMSMIISAMTGTTFDPIESTNWACSHGQCAPAGSYHSIGCVMANEFGLSCKESSDHQEIINSLASGNSLILVLAKKGIFTLEGHFLVLRGVDGEGNISISDPASREKTGKTFKYDELVDPARGHLTKFWIISG